MSRILLLDDEDVVLIGFSDFFRSMGCTVDCARDMQEALSLVETARYELVIADLRLTRFGAEGLRVVEEARARWPGTRTILLTGLLSPEMEAEAQRRGVDRLLQKPVSLTVLESAASGLLGLAYRRPQV